MAAKVEYVWDGYTFFRLIEDHGDGYLTVSQGDKTYVLSKRYFVPVAPTGVPMQSW